MVGEIILHSNLNCFYASVEMNENPRLRGKTIAMYGSTEDRHGIVLTASYPAKRMGVKTGVVNWQARQACPGLICVPPHYDLYIKYSKLMRRIYSEYPMPLSRLAWTKIGCPSPTAEAMSKAKV